MNRALIVYAALLLGSLGWAYQTWTHEDELALADKVVVLPGKVEQLSSVVYRSKDLELTIELREDEHGRYAWGHSVPQAPEEAPPTEDGAEPPPAPKPEEFKVGKAGDPVLEALAPFVAKRRLEGVVDEDLEALGLMPEPEATLEITREGKEPKRFELGGNVFGGANVYVRDPDDGAIYLVEAKLVRPLQNGARTLPDRDLTGIDERKVVEVTLRVGDREASFEQHNPDDNDAKYWSVAGTDDASPEAAAWVEKALRLRSSRYVLGDELPTDLSQAFDFQVRAEDGTEVTVEVLRSLSGGDGDEGQEQFFARSAHTRALVKLPRAAAAEASADLDAALQAGGG
ncbi:DUF4340 domain-containing protein [Paraliomyxa miuraensis]|uniref:DUF4340 domain-containing protein n=1 Tax=Paraliomyxa miuraensis TaxID=376150 RepID=UPI00224E4355|nr:DUF4340 domain-containing protein [Paraliomyxa miuraensis]MCX4246976.1 DUF4340 domain-containing protein [Paraliomyxa miuraensis]